MVRNNPISRHSLILKKMISSSIADVANLFFCAAVGQSALVVKSPEGVELLQGLDERLRGRGVQKIPPGGSQPSPEDPWQ